MTQIVSRAHMLPTGKKAKMRPWVNLTNEAQHGKVSLKHVEDKTVVVSPGQFDFTFVVQS